MILEEQYKQWYKDDQNRISIFQQIEMNKIINLPTSVRPSKQILTVLRIYIVNYITSQQPISSFTKESIDCLAHFIFKCLSSLLIQVKYQLQAQGRTTPNIFHLLSVFDKFDVTACGIVQYLDKKIDRDRESMPQQVIKKYETKRLIERQIRADMETQDDSYKNIISIQGPNLFSIENENQLMPIQRPVSEYLEKPAQYTYKQWGVKMERQEGKNEIIKRSAQMEGEMRLSLKKQRLLNNQQVAKEQRQMSSCYSYEKKAKFEMIKYL